DVAPSRRDPRDERPRPAPLPREERRFDEPLLPDGRRERVRSRDDDRRYEEARPHEDAYLRDERRERDMAPHRDTPSPRRREPLVPDESDAEIAVPPPRRGGNAGPTRRREPAPDVMPHRLPDLTSRPPRREENSGWLSDQYPMPPRRHEDDGPRRRY
nr:hypothetical protein [Ktedonobacterales bacterium]